MSNLNYSGKIKTLSANIIPKIAAGEVVERPASVIKELVENSIDCGATKIIVEVENAGLKKIKVIDDGEGMTLQDLQKCYLSHTTSKIFELEDLSVVKTFGFRGEALASICAVSNVLIKSFDSSAKTGHTISVENGNASGATAFAISKGTIVEVTDLFSSHPARKKFLKSALMENQSILNVLIAFALANTHIGFEYYRDDKQVFKVLSQDTLMSRIEKLLGKVYASGLIPLDFSDSYLKIHGYIGKPQNSAPNRNTQFLFVNKRFIDDLAISKTIKEAYKTLLDARSYPQFVLNIGLDWGLVDVNVHPQKEKVHFYNDSAVQSAVFSAVTNALKKADLTYEFGETYSFDQDKKAIKHMYHKLKDGSPIWDVRDIEEKDSYDLAFQIAKTYIAYSKKGGLVLVDQHAAHESILFDQFVKSYSANLKLSEEFKFDNPIEVEIPLNLVSVLEDNLKRLEKFGFKVNLSANNIAKVISIPEILKGHDISKLLLETLTDLCEKSLIGDFGMEYGFLQSLDESSRKTLAYLACRSAIKAGDRLNKQEIKRLLHKLEECSDLYTCPHGRPIKINLSLGELGKLFKRVK